MRRFRRWALNLAAVVSAVLFGAACMLWVRSWSINEWVQWQRVGGGTTETWWLDAVDGRVGLSGERIASLNHPADSNLSWHHAPTGRHRLHWNPDQAFPGWHLMVYTGALPLWWVVRRHYSTRTRRYRLGLCPCCGYDLRATPDHCPECGAVPTVAK